MIKIQTITFNKVYHTVLIFAQFFITSYRNPSGVLGLI